MSPTTPLTANFPGKRILSFLHTPMPGHNNPAEKRIHELERMSPHDLHSVQSQVEEEAKSGLSRGKSKFRRRVKQVLRVREEDEQLHTAVEAHRAQDKATARATIETMQAEALQAMRRQQEQDTLRLRQKEYDEGYEAGRRDKEGGHGNFDYFYSGAKRDGYKDGYEGLQPMNLATGQRREQPTPPPQRQEQPYDAGNSFLRHQSRSPFVVQADESSVQANTSDISMHRYDELYAEGQRDQNGWPPTNRSLVFDNPKERQAYEDGFFDRVRRNFPSQPQRESAGTSQDTRRAMLSRVEEWQLNTDEWRKREAAKLQRTSGERAVTSPEQQRYDEGFEIGRRDRQQGTVNNSYLYNDFYKKEGYIAGFHGDSREIISTSQESGHTAASESPEALSAARYVAGYMMGVDEAWGYDHSNRHDDDPIKKQGYQDGRMYAQQSDRHEPLEGFEIPMLRTRYEEGFRKGVAEAKGYDYSDRMADEMARRGYRHGRASVLYSQKPQATDQAALPEHHLAEEWYNAGYERGEYDNFYDAGDREIEEEIPHRKRGYHDGFTGAPRAYPYAISQQELWDIWFERGKEDKDLHRQDRSRKIIGDLECNAYNTGLNGHARRSDLSKERVRVMPLQPAHPVPDQREAPSEAERRYNAGHALGLDDRDDGERCVNFQDADTREGYNDAFDGKPNKFTVARQARGQSAAGIPFRDREHARGAPDDGMGWGRVLSP